MDRIQKGKEKDPIQQHSDNNTEPRYRGGTGAERGMELLISLLLLFAIPVGGALLIEIITDAILDYVQIRKTRQLAASEKKLKKSDYLLDGGG